MNTSLVSMVALISYFQKVLIFRSFNCDLSILNSCTNVTDITFYIIMGVNVKEAEKAKEVVPNLEVEKEERGKAK